MNTYVSGFLCGLLILIIINQIQITKKINDVDWKVRQVLGKLN